ncbi:MAG TPA: enolase C-terminal domain-like protein [Chthoniobacteraceae bacterium]|nr:enolase C-terminal domain-like protein [Chthoniobacteraceae bacterium]
MALSTDIIVKEAELFFLPIATRVPLKFGAQIVTQVTCARVRLRVEDGAGRSAEGWGETPLSVAWVWPADLPWETREERLKSLCVAIGRALVAGRDSGHPMELAHRFQRDQLGALVRENAPAGSSSVAVPHLAALLCHSLFDLATFDAFATLHARQVFACFDRDLLSTDLAAFLEPRTAFAQKWPAQFLTARVQRLPVWHLVGGLDPISASDLTGSEPKDAYPVLLRDWIRTDGLRCLKIKLCGNDDAWDYERIAGVGRIAIEENCAWLSADFNCTVTDPEYVNGIVDRVRRDAPAIDRMLLYIEQPFPYDLEANRIDVRSVSARKPLFLDESAHDWRYVRLGRELGWSGVALKTCKTLTGAVLSLCWARTHAMQLMVQDLTNPMLAQIPHLLLAAHAGTMMGVESNAMQFYPEASMAEAVVHPGIYRRRQGVVDLETLGDVGFGYRVDEIGRLLPPRAAHFG